MGILNIKAIQTYTSELKKNAQQTLVKKVRSNCSSCNKKQGGN